MLNPIETQAFAAREREREKKINSRSISMNGIEGMGFGSIHMHIYDIYTFYTCTNQFPKCVVHCFVFWQKHVRPNDQFVSKNNLMKMFRNSFETICIFIAHLDN